MRIILFVGAWMLFLSVCITPVVVAAEFEVDQWQFGPLLFVLGLAVGLSMLTYFYSHKKMRAALAVASLLTAGLPYFAMWWTSEGTRLERAYYAADHTPFPGDRPETPAQAAWLPVQATKAEFAAARVLYLHEMANYDRERPTHWFARIMNVVLLVLPGLVGGFFLLRALRGTEQEATAIVSGKEDPSLA